jgi:hypothetical protein
MRRSTQRACLPVAFSIALLLLAGCFGSSDTSSPTTSAGPALTDLRSVSQFRSLFNEAEGKARLIVLLAPT